jgi:hypothetical protein
MIAPFHTSDRNIDLDKITSSLTLLHRQEFTNNAGGSIKEIRGILGNGAIGTRLTSGNVTAGTRRP